MADRPSLDQPAVNVPAAGLVAAMAFLRDQHGFDMLVDVAGVDWSQGVSPRFTVVYHLLSTTDHDYVRVAADCRDDASPELPSVTSLWHGANWHEREAFDMFGIRFTGHAGQIEARTKGGTSFARSIEIHCLFALPPFASFALFRGAIAPLSA